MLVEFLWEKLYYIHFSVEIIRAISSLFMCVFLRFSLSLLTGNSSYENLHLVLTEFEGISFMHAKNDNPRADQEPKP